MPLLLKTYINTCLFIQKARQNQAEREALHELLMSREKENQTLTFRLAESQDAVLQLKQLVEDHVASEREKNKRVSYKLATTAVTLSLLSLSIYSFRFIVSFL